MDSEISQHRKPTLEKKIIPLLLKPMTFRSQAWHPNHWDIPTPSILSPSPGSSMTISVALTLHLSLSLSLSLSTHIYNYGSTLFNMNSLIQIQFWFIPWTIRRIILLPRFNSCETALLLLWVKAGSPTWKYTYGSKCPLSVCHSLFSLI